MLAHPIFFTSTVRSSRVDCVYALLVATRALIDAATIDTAANQSTKKLFNPRGEPGTERAFFENRI